MTRIPNPMAPCCSGEEAELGFGITNQNASEPMPFPRNSEGRGKEGEGRERHLAMKRPLLAILISGGGAASAFAAPPNIILMMGDDHGWEETGYNGHPHVKTPVLDEMARSGLRFDRFHAAHPNCSPTRASFLTGRHPSRMGTFAPGWSFRPEEITLAHLLGKAGYPCGAPPSSRLACWPCPRKQDPSQISDRL